MKEVVDWVVPRKEALRLSRRLEALHLPFASSCRLVRILGPVVEPLMPATLDARHEILLGCGIAGELVRDHHPWRAALPLQQLAQQPLGRFSITPALNQNVENDAVLVNRSPEPVLCRGDGDHDLVQVPLVAGPRQASADGVRERLAELERPLPHRLVADDNAAGCEHLLACHGSYSRPRDARKTPLGQAHLMSFELIPLAPLNPLRQLQGMTAGSP